MDNYDIDFSQMSAIKSRRNNDDPLEIDSNRFNQSQSINMSHYQSHIGDSQEVNRSSLLVKTGGARNHLIGSFK